VQCFFQTSIHGSGFGLKPLFLSYPFFFSFTLSQVKHPLPLPTQLFHGLHEFDWHLAPSSACIPLRVDGEVTRVGSGLKPLRLLATENSQKRDHNSQTHRREAGIDGPVAHETFLTNFPAANARACTRTLKESAAKERLDMEPSSIQVSGHTSRSRCRCRCMLEHVHCACTC
jgi:hypothetical protein